MKSQSLSQAYNKEREQVGITVQKTYFTKLSTGAIYAEDGFNLREIDPEHVALIAKAYKAGQYVPAIVVKPTPRGLKIIDGHHRYYAAKQAKIEAIEVKNFTGDEVAYMITSSQGRNLTPLERARGYQRLINQGNTNNRIVELTGRSISDVRNHLTLLTASAKVQQAVQDGTAGFAAVVEELNRAGFDGEAKIEEKLDKGEKVTRTSLMRWKPKDSRRVVELLSELEIQLPDELRELLNKFRGEV